MKIVPPTPLTRKRMRATPRSNTPCELALRKELFKLGLRYRIDVAVGRQRIDIAFPNARVAVLVDGCYWHGCGRHWTVPLRNRRWWIAKISENRKRDVRNRAALRREGWAVIQVWEHEEPEKAASRIFKRVRARRNR